MNLLESGPQKTLFHYTNWNGFVGILKSGMLRPKRYKSGTHDLKSSVKEKWKQRGEVAAIRPSLASTRNMEKISSSAGGGIRFIIKADVLKDKQRNIKIKPIAEFPIGAIKNMRKTLTGRIHGINRTFYYSDEEAEKIINKIITNIGKLKYSKKFSSYHINSKDLVDFIKKVTGEPVNNQRYDYGNKTQKEISPGVLNYEMVELIKWARNREGEERIVVKQGIRLNPDFLKIEILPRVRLGKMDLRLAKRVLLKKDLFIKNSSYKRLIFKAKKVIEAEKK